MKDIGQKPCLFCEWSVDLQAAQDKLKKKAEVITVDDMAHLFPAAKKPWKSQFLMANEHFFAVLCIEPKVEGHTLIISRKHFPSMADPALKQESNEFKLAFLDIMAIVANKLTIVTEDTENPKVYFMSMCEHWTPKELDIAKSEFHTEQLHFHLLPRHKMSRAPYPHFHPESVFIRCDKKVNPEELEETRKKILLPL